MTMTKTATRFLRTSVGRLTCAVAAGTAIGATAAVGAAGGSADADPIKVETYGLFKSAVAGKLAVSGMERAVEENGLDASRAVVIRDDSNGRVSALPGPGGRPCYLVSLPDGSNGGGCAQGGGALVINGTRGAVGVVPDSVASVSVTGGDGSAQEVAVVGNVWHGAAGATSVTYVIRGGKIREELISPDGFTADGAGR